MKYAIVRIDAGSYESPPTRGAWIEIGDGHVPVTKVTGSPPTRGAWIEIAALGVSCREVLSPPTRGAWIEIPLDAQNLTYFTKSPPTRGAWIEISWSTWSMESASVAPHTGGVD